MSRAALIARSAVRCGRILTPSFAWWLGTQLGWAFGGMPGRDQSRARTHLAIAFPDRDSHWIAHTARRCFRHFGGMALWTLATLHWDARRSVRGMAMEGTATIRELFRVHRRGQSTIGFTGHFGNWELLARVGNLLAPLTTIGRRMRDPGLNELLINMRRGNSVIANDIIYTDEGPRPVLRALRSGRLVSVLVDQDLPRLPGVFVPWFGQLAWTPVGAAQLAVATRTAVMPAFLFRVAGRWVVHFGPRRTWPVSGDKERDATALTAWITAYEETLVRRYPEQWAWWHKRWRTRPESERELPLASRH